MRPFAALLVVLLASAPCACGGPEIEARIPPPPPMPPVTEPMVMPIDKIETRPAAAELAVAPDLAARLAKLAPFEMGFDDAKLSEADKKVLKPLVEASSLVHELFVRQIDPSNPELRARLAADPSKALALRYFDIMAGPWDGLAHDEPFVGARPRPAGAAFYPPDMTKQELEAHLAASPGDKEAFQGFFTVIVRRDGKLAAMPYSQAYRSLLDPVAAKLREAAAAATEPTLKRFLELRAGAFASNDYVESDKAWMDVKGPIEVTIGPYETYADQMFQFKASFEAFVSLRDVAESKKLEVIGKQMAALEKNLPMADQHKKEAASRAKGSPIDVVHLLCNAGQAGVQTVAYNLPNDERVRKDKGSKKVMLKNVLQGKFERIVRPIAEKLLAADQVGMLEFDAVFTYILMHEVAHGLGPGFITAKDGSKVQVSQALRDLYGALEEAKADITGLVDAQYLIDRKVYPAALEKKIYVAYLATALRQMRFGLKEAHGRGVVASVHYLTSKGAVVHDAKTGRFRVDFAKIKGAVRELAREYLTLEAEGDYEGAKKFFERWAVATPELEKAVASIGAEIPVDIAPRFSVYEKAKGW
jgi:hypothetical protein